MDLDTIEKLILYMEHHGLNELQVRQGDLEFKARRGERREMPLVIQQAPPYMTPPHLAPAPHANPTLSERIGGKAKDDEGGKVFKEIRCPIVGTFYRRPHPTKAPFIEVGDRIKAGDVVCIVEAMKVMNEIKSDLSGVISKILVEDVHPVEFDQPLFLVECS